MLKRYDLGKALTIQEEFKDIILHMDKEGLWEKDYTYCNNRLSDDIKRNEYKINITPEIVVKAIDIKGSSKVNYEYSFIVFEMKIDGVKAMKIKYCKDYPVDGFLDIILDAIMGSADCFVTYYYKIPKEIIKTINEWSRSQLEKKLTAKKEEQMQNQESINKVGEKYKK